MVVQAMIPLQKEAYIAEHKYVLLVGPGVLLPFFTVLGYRL